MRLIIAFLIFFLGLNTIIYINKVNELEFIVFDLYSNDFIDYLSFDDEIKMNYNVEKLGMYFEERGFKFKSIGSELSFSVSFRQLFKYEKEYVFYLEKNNDFQ